MCHAMAEYMIRIGIQFLDEYLSALSRANDDGADVRGYFLWTFLDNFEWDKGYNERFGIVYVDFATQKRIVKDSAYWYQKVIESNGKELGMNKQETPILFLNPVFTHNIWGGTRLRTDFGYEVEGDDIGECWGVAAHQNGDDTIREGISCRKETVTVVERRAGTFRKCGYRPFPASHQDH